MVQQDIYLAIIIICRPFKCLVIIYLINCLIGWLLTLGMVGNRWCSIWKGVKDQNGCGEKSKNNGRGYDDVKGQSGLIPHQGIIMEGDEVEGS